MSQNTEPSKILSPQALEHVLLTGDLAKLSSADRLRYYGQVCESVGLNPITQPFEYLRLNGKTILYARKAATEQLRQIHKVAITIVDKQHVAGCYVVTARASTPDGRTDESTGAVPLYDNNGCELVGEALCNALMKAETKAKRRVTLGICGLATLDDTEVDSIPGAKRVVDGELEPDTRPSAPVIRLPSASENQTPENSNVRVIEVTTRRGSKARVSEVTEELFQRQLNACMREKELVDWAGRVMRSTLPDFTKRELRQMLKRHATRLGFDHNQITAAAKQGK